jgi:cell division protein FtsL
MTVITFAKQGFISTAFGGKSFAFRAASPARHRIKEFSLLGVLAAVGLAALSTIGILGIRSNLLAMTVSRQAVEISRLETEIEGLRLKVITLSSPSKIADEARMLQLVESAHPNRYLTLTPPGEVALKE